ncbi:MAG: hypothetical protein AMXMBFR82_42020 [Candidatus Hydrogenedentota bacterium]
MIALYKPNEQHDEGREPRQVAKCAAGSITRRPMRRREFFRYAASVVGGAAFAEYVAGGSLTNAWADNPPEDAAAEDEPFAGYNLMLYVYGDFTCNQLFTTPFGEFADEIEGKVRAAVAEGLIAEENANRIGDLLGTLKSAAPTIKAKDMYLLDGSSLANPEDFDAVRDLCQQIDQLGLLLPFAYQQAGPNGEILDNAKIAFHERQDESMISSQGVGEETLRSLYTTAFVKDEDGRIAQEHARFRAITRAKKGGVFGPKPQMGERVFAAFSQAYLSAVKGNSRACSMEACEPGQIECCVPCANPEYYCGMDPFGECVATSDLYDSTCAPGEQSAER